MKKLIILDLDGTLIDSVPDLTDAANHMRAQFRLPAFTEPEVRNLVGEGAKRLVERALAGFDAESLAMGLNYFLDFNFKHIADKTVFYPGVMKTLKKLKQDGHILTVASNKSTPHCKEILRVLKADPLFDAILGAESVAERKPSPEPIIHLMQQFAMAQNKTVMIGDSINDIAAGKGAGVFTIGCDYGYGAPEELQESDIIISAFPEIIAALTGEEYRFAGE